MFISSIMLVNLLVAMYSATYEKLMRNSAMELTWFKWEWLMTLQQNDGWFVPPSLSSILLLLTMMKSMKSVTGSCIVMLHQRREGKRRMAMRELGRSQSPSLDHRDTHLDSALRDTEMDDGPTPPILRTPPNESPATGRQGGSGEMPAPDRTQSSLSARSVTFSCSC